MFVATQETKSYKTQTEAENANSFINTDYLPIVHMKGFVLFHFPLDTIGFNKVILLLYLHLSQSA